MLVEHDLSKLSVRFSVFCLARYDIKLLPKICSTVTDFFSGQ
jgi:hypothetical protein